MADRLRNEVAIQLGGEERTMRATFSAIRGIETSLGVKILPLIDSLTRGEVGVTQCAVIIFHGLKGNDDTRLKNVDEVGEAIMEQGLPSVMAAVVEFIGKTMEGPEAGKPEKAASA